MDYMELNPIINNQELKFRGPSSLQQSLFVKLTIILLFILLFSSCIKEGCVHFDDETYHINAAENAVIHNNGKDTIRFLRNNTDTVTYIGSGTQKYFTSWQDREGDCPGHIHYDEANKIEFINPLDSSKIIFIHQVSGNSEPVGNINIDFLHFHQFYNDYYDLIRAEDSVMSRGKMYYNVQRLFSVYHADSLFFYQPLGILKVVTPNYKYELID